MVLLLGIIWVGIGMQFGYIFMVMVILFLLQDIFMFQCLHHIVNVNIVQVIHCYMMIL